MHNRLKQLRAVAPAFLMASVVLVLAGCATKGPGAECDTCAGQEVAPAATGPFAQAAGAAAEGGQRASNQPMMLDPARLAPVTNVNRGAGPLTASQANTEERSQAGAPSVTQGLVVPTSADARTGGGVSPVVASLQSYLDDLRASLKLALMDPAAPPGRVRELMDAINGTAGLMAQAQASAQATTHNTYNFDGARIVQSVANGSNSGDGTTAIDPAAAAAVGKPLEGAARSVMEAPGAAPAPSGEAPTPAPGAPSPPPAPAGEPGAAPAGGGA